MRQTASLAHAQQYPTKPIRVLTAEVGGGRDFTARLISQRLSETLGQQIVVDNRTGGVIHGTGRRPPAQFTQMIKVDAERTGKLIKAAGIRAE